MVVLEGERLFERMRLVFWGAFGGGAPFEFDVILNQHVVLEKSDRGWLLKLALVVKSWRMVNNIVGLPLAWLARDVDQRRVLFVNRAGLAVVIGLVAVGIEHLHFVAAFQINPAVASPPAPPPSPPPVMPTRPSTSNCQKLA